MALQISYPSALGFTFPSAYVKIDSLHYTNTECIINARAWADAAARAANLPVVFNQSYSMPYDATGTSLTAAYDYLKTLPDFTGATDV